MEIVFFDIVETLHIVVGVNRYIVPFFYYSHQISPTDNNLLSLYKLTKSVYNSVIIDKGDIHGLHYYFYILRLLQNS